MFYFTFWEWRQNEWWNVYSASYLLHPRTKLSWHKYKTLKISRQKLYLLIRPGLFLLSYNCKYVLLFHFAWCFSPMFWNLKNLYILDHRQKKKQQENIADANHVFILTSSYSKFSPSQLELFTHIVSVWRVGGTCVILMPSHTCIINMNETWEPCNVCTAVPCVCWLNNNCINVSVRLCDSVNTQQWHMTHIAYIWRLKSMPKKRFVMCVNSLSGSRKKKNCITLCDSVNDWWNT